MQSVHIQTCFAGLSGPHSSQRYVTTEAVPGAPLVLGSNNSLLTVDF